MRRDRIHRAIHIFFRLGLAQTARCIEGVAGRYVAVQWIVRAGLVGEKIGSHTSPHDLRQNLRAIADESHREPDLFSNRFVDPIERFIQRRRHAIAVT